MTTRINIKTLLQLTLGLTALSGCDGFDEADSFGEGFDETQAELELDETETETETETELDEDPTEPAIPDTLISSPQDEQPVSAPVNLALGRWAWQSSTTFGGGAERAVDGNLDGNWGNGSVTHTDIGSNWWQVDLGSTQPVGEIVIWNRTDCCAERLHDFTVYVTVDGSHWDAFPVSGVAGQRTQVLIDRPARWVRIENPDILSLAEVEVFRTKNLAYGKPTSQSSTAVGGSSARAVDGNTDGYFGHNSVTHTEDGLVEWWQVDLESVQAIGHAVLFNRTDCCSDRLHDFKVRVSNDGQNWFDFPQYVGPAGPKVVIPINREARFVRIENGAGPLHLAEVQLFEAPRLPGLSYGRGVGTIPSYGCGQGDEQDGLLCYPSCGDGYYGVGPVCWQHCAPGYTDTGAFCSLGWHTYAKHSYGRGAGTPLIPTCGNNVYDAGLCYQPCDVGYKGVGPVCWLEGITIGQIGAASCDLLRVPFMSDLATEIDAAMTFGAGLGVAAGATVSAELGVAYGPDGEFGCYVSGCGGFTTGGVSISAFATVGAYTDFGDIAGQSTVISAGPSFGIPETPISIGGTLGLASNQDGSIGMSVSASVSLDGGEPISFAVNGLTCETAVLQTQGQ